MSKSCPVYGKAIYMNCLECEDKLCKSKSKRYDKVIIGIDQSYKNTGISIVCDGVLKQVKSIKLNDCQSNSERRRVLSQKLNSLLKLVVQKSDEQVCIIERIRLQSQGFINIDYIKSIGALNATIVDCCSHYNIKVYSVDTRCWKAQVVGTSKPKSNKFGVPPEKWPTVQWCIKQGFKDSILVPVFGRRSKGTFLIGDQKYEYNNDAADSSAIAMFGVIGDQNKLKEEH